MSRWLEDFAQRTSIGNDMSVIGAGLNILIALITFSGKSFRAATATPVKALREE